MTSTSSDDAHTPEHALEHRGIVEAATGTVNAVLTPDRKKMLKHEFRELLIIVLYLAASLSFVSTMRCLILIQHGINDFVQGYIMAIVEAVALGKVVLLAQNLPVLAAWENRRLAWSVLYKSMIMTAIVATAGHFEQRLLHHGSAHTVHPQLFFVAHCLAFMVIFIVLFTARELDKELGPGRLFKLCFGERTGRIKNQESN